MEDEEAVQITAEEWEYQYLGAFEVEVLSEDDKQVVNVAGGNLKVVGEVKTYFGGLFNRSAADYPILIDFVPEEKKQQNPVRDLVRRLATGSTAERRKTTKELATRLGRNTPGQAKNGLFVAMVGKRENVTRVVAWRFAAGASLHLDTKKDSDEAEITIDQRSFNRQNKQFKSCMFEDEDGATSFWSGYVLDRQTHESDLGHARYWVDRFLQSKSQVTDTRGTKLLVKALKESRNEGTPAQRDELAQAANLLRTQKKRLSLQKFADDYLNDDTREVFLKHVPENVRGSPFTVDRAIFTKKVGMRRIIINDTISIKAPSDIWDKHIKLGAEGPGGVRDITVIGKITRRDDLVAE